MSISSAIVIVSASALFGRLLDAALHRKYSASLRERLGDAALKFDDLTYRKLIHDNPARALSLVQRLLGPRWFSWRLLIISTVTAISGSFYLYFLISFVVRTNEEILEEPSMDFYMWWISGHVLFLLLVNIVLDQVSFGVTKRILLATIDLPRRLSQRGRQKKGRRKRKRNAQPRPSSKKSLGMGVSLWALFGGLFCHTIISIGLGLAAVPLEFALYQDLTGYTDTIEETFGVFREMYTNGFGFLFKRPLGLILSEEHYHAFFYLRLSSWSLILSSALPSCVHWLIVMRDLASKLLAKPLFTVLSGLLEQAYAEKRPLTWICSGLGAVVAVAKLWIKTGS